MAAGYRHVRVQLAVPGFSGTAWPILRRMRYRKRALRAWLRRLVFEPTPYINNTVKMFDYLRSRIGFDVDFVHDVHERVAPAQALVLSKAVEPFRLFFLKIRRPRRMWPGSRCCASKARRRLPWANCS